MKTLLLSLLLLIPMVASSQELVTLTTPIVKTATGCVLDQVLLDVGRNRIVASLVCAGGDPISRTYDSFTTPTGATLLHNLNIGNFSTNSLIKAVYNRLITDGVITGTISGIPQ